MILKTAEARDWQGSLPQGAGSEELFETFKEKAEALMVKVIRVASKEEAISSIMNQMKESKVKNAVAVPMSLIDAEALKERALAQGLTLSVELNREYIEQAEFGISEFDFAIADLGSIVQDAHSVHKRLVSTLPPIHLTIISTKTIIDTFEDSLELIQKVYGNNPSNFIAYVTGPSKTADIERVLTIGVHGPGRLIIVCMD